MGDEFQKRERPLHWEEECAVGGSIKRDWEEEYRALGSVFGRRSKTEQDQNRNKGRCLQGATLQCRYAFLGS